ncbi:uncharacterized protein UTRI_04919 [Ustilago trichophora]|uniref:WLM domain-containing protein n=1 Tax=Ustilago trichophora TaxID=86804 RepID=A0A5C3EDF2_9BASI|nr:uncharacterized protein UTRI_04919 [Ustilago trichophora]
MVHLRLNDPDTSRNKHINYITALPQHADCEHAHHRLLQLAAQVQPLMKKHGFQINSLEEFQWNPEFAGRNWNNGETVELVLRRQDGSFAPLQWVLMVFCHELAHIKFMNHIPSQHGKLDRELRDECRQLQARGYYGDGFWSAGQRLHDNAFIAGSGINSLQGLPQYSCGGAFQSKPSKNRTTKRRQTSATSGSRKRGFRGPSLHTGAQTAPNTKATRRIHAPLPGQGSRVDGQNHLPKASASNSAYKQDVNSTFRKRTQTASARELRAEAAMRRFAALKTENFDVKSSAEHDTFWPEERQDAKQNLQSSTLPRNGRDNVKEQEGSELETETEDEEDTKSGGLIIRLDDSSEDESDRKTAARPSNSAQQSESTDKVRTKEDQDSHEYSTFASSESEKQRLERSRLYRQHELKQGAKIRSTNDDWQDFCSIASLPKASSTVETLASKVGNQMHNANSHPIEILSSDEEDAKAAPSPQRNNHPLPILTTPASEQQWSCQVCTLLNPGSALRCDACLTTKGSFLVGQ